MEKHDINKLIAERVMGYTLMKNEKLGGNLEGYGTSDGKFWYSHFNPTEDIDHTMRVVEKFPTWQLTKMLDGKYRAIVKANRFVAYDESPTMAICLACLKVIEENT